MVDDEAPARRRLTDLLRQEQKAVEIVEAADGLSAVEIIGRRPFDLVFLDVQMPELDGLGVLEAIGPAHMPLTVFVTAYDQHAIRAFDINALDYLLKPFSDERFEAALARGRQRLSTLKAGELGQSMLQALATTPRGLDRLIVKSAGATHVVRIAAVDWIEAAGVYVTLHTAGRELLYRSGLAQLAARLDPSRFIQVHRSTIVNIDSIVRLEPASHGEFDLILRDGSQTRLSRTYRATLEQRLGQEL